MDAAGLCKARTRAKKEDGDQFGYLSLSVQTVIHWRRAPSPKTARLRIKRATSPTRGRRSAPFNVFTRSGTTWSQQAYRKALEHNCPRRPIRLFRRTKRHGDTMAVGTYDEDRGQRRCLHFTRTGATWSQQNRLTTSNAEPGDSLGCSIAISDDGKQLLRAPSTRQHPPWHPAAE